MVERFTRSRVLRNVFAVASGTAAAQLVAFGFAPLVTRIYSPEAFGLQGVFLSLIAILSPVVALRYPMAIVTAETEEEARKLSYLSVAIAAGMAGMLLSLLLAQLLAGGPLSLRHLGADGLGNLILLLPFALFAVAVQDVTEFRAARIGRFRLMGWVEVLQSLVVNLTRVMGGLVAPVAAMLVAVSAVAPALKAAMLRLGAPPLRESALVPVRAEASALLRRHRDFPVYRMPTDVLNAGSQAVPVILLAALFSPAAAGLYALARSVLNLPVNILGASVGNVLYARFAEMAREGRPLLPFLLLSTGALLALAPFIIGFAWFAPPVFAFVFGEGWREAGHYAQWMALWLGISLANVPAVRLAPVIQAQGVLLSGNILIFVARVAAIAGIGWLGGDARDAVAVFSVASLIGNAGLIVAIVLAARARRATLEEG